MASALLSKSVDQSGFDVANQLNPPQNFQSFLDQSGAISDLHW